MVGSGDREDRLLLCDSCDLAHHLECLTPPLSRVPRGLWYCPQCTPLLQQRARGRAANRTVNLDDDEEDDDMDDFIVPDEEVEADWGQMAFVLPRTLATVRVRQRITLRRRARVLSESSVIVSPTRTQTPVR